MTTIRDAVHLSYDPIDAPFADRPLRRRPDHMFVKAVAGERDEDTNRDVSMKYAKYACKI